jgi:hypothetical protein
MQYMAKNFAKRCKVPLDMVYNKMYAMMEAAIGHPCPYCQREVTVFTASPDHMIPLSREGDHGMTNVLIVCKDCNITKGDMTKDEFLFLLTALAGMPEAKARVIKRLKMGGIMYAGRGRKWRNKGK